MKRINHKSSIVILYLLSFFMVSNICARTPDTARQIGSSHTDLSGTGWSAFYESDQAKFYIDNYEYGLSIYSKNTEMVRLLIESKSPLALTFTGPNFIPGPRQYIQSATVNAEFSCDANVVRLAKDATGYNGLMGSQNETFLNKNMFEPITPASDYEVVKVQPNTWQSGLLDSMCKGRRKLIPIIDLERPDPRMVGTPPKRLGQQGTWYIDQTTFSVSKKGEVSGDVVLEGIGEMFEVPTPDKIRSVRFNVTMLNCRKPDITQINKVEYYSGHFGEGVLIKTDPIDKSRKQIATEFGTYVCRAPGSGWGKFPEVR